MQVGKKLRSFPACIPDGHLHRVTYTRCRIDTADSPDDEHGVCSKHVEYRNKRIRKELCVKLVVYKNHTKMRGQQNIKSQVFNTFHDVITDFDYTYMLRVRYFCLVLSKI